MPKPKQFLKENKKKSKHAPPVPTTADEYLAAGVEFEEAGEKWRGGDAVKSTRFFVRALDCYDEGLKKFSESFDLAYNKARLQYEITQHPKLLQQLPGTLLELLQTAIESSRYALKLNSENADALFNTAQALRSYSEATIVVDQNPSRHLEEALWLFELCLETQVRGFDKDSAAEAKALKLAAAAESSKDVEMGDAGTLNTSRTDAESATEPSTNLSQSEETAWARIFEPVTKDTIIETLIAQLDTLSMLSKEITPSDQDAVRRVVEYYKNPIKPVLERFSPNSSDRSLDIKLAIANYKCAAADLQYNAEQIDLGQYENIVNTAYNFDMSKNPEAMCDAGESLVTFHAALAYLSINCEPYLTQRWNSLSKAQEYFTSASKLPDAEHKEKIHTMRGDVEMLRFQLGQDSVGYAPAAKNKDTLLRNANKFYQGAMEISVQSGLHEASVEAQIKLLIVEAFGGKTEDLRLAEKVLKEFRKVLSEAAADGVVTGQQLAAFNIAGY
ncbi:hypothetical protein EG329_006122 [Mollisiaceae sp. DMI_Dod_QoI]|nr:hypothetical protein EG329_006122 [Helotiales sp. DMI_Dod_QoI]